MFIKISIIVLFGVMLISGTIAPTMVFAQYNEGGIGGLTPQYVPESDCVFPDEKITYTLDKDTYVIGETMTITGQVIAEPSTNQADPRANVFTSFVKAKSVFVTPFTDGTSQQEWYNLDEEEENASIMSRNASLSTLDTKVIIDECGYFETKIKLQPIVFKNGVYLLQLIYSDTVIQQDVLVFDSSLQKGCFTTTETWANNSATKMEEHPAACTDKESFPLPEVVLELEKEEYLPGEKVKISGQIKNAFFYDDVELTLNSVIDSTESEIKSKLFKLTGKEPTFFMSYNIPSGADGIGKYSVSVNSHLDPQVGYFTVNDESIVTDYASEKSSASSDKKIKKIIEKHNRISVSKVPISLGEKSSGELTLLPRVIQGSLFTVARGAESTINLQVSSSTGQCVIGQDYACAVNDSTRKPGSIYELVQIDGKNYKVRYSGPDVRLEKFTILPEITKTEIDMKNWDVTILKDDEPTRFYYKISYVSFE